MKISTIIFDLGKVLVDYDFWPALQKVAANASHSAEEIAVIVRESAVVIDYETGRISTEIFFRHLKEKFQFAGTEDELLDIWCDIFTPLDEHIALARQLSHNYPLALLSNTDDAHIRFLEARHDFFSIFQEKIYSYQVGLMKPDPQIYDIALQRMNADKYETLFIDDIEENILVPSQMGWQTIHLRPDVTLKPALQSYDLKGIV